MQYVIITLGPLCSTLYQLPVWNFVLVICLWLHPFVAICKVVLKIFHKGILYKMLNYAFLKIQAQQARNIDAAVCFSLYLLLEWTQQLC